MLFYVHHERPWIFFELVPFIFLGILGVSGRCDWWSAVGGACVCRLAEGSCWHCETA